MGHKPGTPLPATLDGVITERPIKIDRALLYLIGGALEWLVDKEPLEETGALTVEAARSALSNMLWDFYHEVVPVDTNPIGMIQLWPIDTPPENWLICDGTSTHLKEDYPDFAALIEGSVWDGGVFYFAVPDLRARVPVGSGLGFSIGATGGAATHTLTESEMPAHNHNFSSGTAAGTGAYVVRANSTLASSAHVTTTDGGGQAHNNMQPFTVLQYIIRVK